MLLLKVHDGQSGRARRLSWKSDNVDDGQMVSGKGIKESRRSTIIVVRAVGMGRLTWSRVAGWIKGGDGEREDGGKGEGFLKKFGGGFDQDIDEQDKEKKRGREDDEE
ncbi:hypothetical protein Tco_0441493 [Tanacetum coccineum]